MSYVYIHVGLDDEVRVRKTTRTDEYAVAIGAASIFLPSKQAEQLRDALDAALDEQEGES